MTGLLGAPLPAGYGSSQPRPSPAPFANMPRTWLSQLRVETQAPSAYARRQRSWERMIDAASLDDSD